MENKLEFKQIRQTLENEHRQLLHSLVEYDSMAEILESFDECDLATQYETQELQSSLNDISAHILDRIHLALERLNSGTYGFCLRCKEVIPYERLVALPYAELCITCQTRLEKESAKK